MSEYNDKPRLIERAFPLKQASLDSVHEKTVRSGHIASLHLWPARRPLAACRAALVATLLPDPGNDEERKVILEKLGGKIVQKVKKSKDEEGNTEERFVEETEGGVLHWGRESGQDMDWFREKIKEAHSGRAPKVLDPFAGGGAIPLEAMRLGCDVTAMDINPVAWFVLKSTLEYPQKLTGKTLPLPDFAVNSTEFMEAYFKARKVPNKQRQKNLELVKEGRYTAPNGNLADHVRAWGWWIMQQARVTLKAVYPIVDNKQTVAYLWARTVECKNCRATIPLLKTCWLSKVGNRRVLLVVSSNEEASGVLFGVREGIPVSTGTRAEKRKADKETGSGTMTRNGVWCPCCGKPNTVAMTMDDIRKEGHRQRIGAMLTVVAVDGPNGKEFRLPTEEERKVCAEIAASLGDRFPSIPFGIPDEPTPTQSQFSGIANYGILKWSHLFMPRQLLALGTIVECSRRARDEMSKHGYSNEWIAALISYEACVFDRLLDFANCGAQWKIDVPTINHSFVRFALPLSWDYAEGNILSDLAGGYSICRERICTALDGMGNVGSAPVPTVKCQSATQPVDGVFDVVITDPPYYGAIPYSDIMDFFYVWLRRFGYGVIDDFETLFKNPLGPKWSAGINDGELIDDPSRFDGDAEKSKAVYEDGMYNAFSNCQRLLAPDGRMVVVFAHKDPNAWESLVAGIIRAGFVVDGSWPIQTEQAARMRAQASAALSSSVWLVCKKRPQAAKPGWDNRVLEEMRVLIAERLRSFWDAGIRGPDFVWAATGPALEAYSKYPFVKKANEAGQVMTVSEFLRHVRRMVVDFVVGRVLTHNGDTQAVSELDELTTYYILHRHDFGMVDAPIGPCILYAVSCGLSDRALADQFDLLARTGGQEVEEVEEEGNDDEESDVAEGTGSKVKLKAWNQRNRKNMGHEAPNGRSIPIIDLIHRLMHLWKAGDVVEVNDYVNEMGLLQNRLFHQVLQAVIEMAPEKSNERSMLESISNHLAGLEREGIPVVVRYPKPPVEDQIQMQAEGFEVQAPTKTKKKKSK